MGSTVYSIGFVEGKFLMVYNTKRKGWEMPGGSIETGETVEDAAVREFLEESGYNVRIVSTRDLGHCFVCACQVLSKNNEECEMISEFFDSLPSNVSFDKNEYHDTIPWAENVLKKINTVM